jgi:hypothetical protein
VQHGRVEAPFVAVSRREDSMPGGTQATTRAPKVSFGNPYTVDGSIEAVRVARIDRHLGTHVVRFKTGVKTGVSFDFQAPSDWSMAHTNRALKLVLTWLVATTGTGTAQLKIHNKYLNANDNDSINYGSFGSTTLGQMPLVADGLTAYAMQDISHNVTTDSPADAGTPKECSLCTVSVIRDGADVSDTWGSDIWLVIPKCFAYFYLAGDATDHFDSDQDHPVAIAGGLCTHMGA